MDWCSEFKVGQPPRERERRDSCWVDDNLGGLVNQLSHAQKPNGIALTVSVVQPDRFVFILLHIYEED